MSSEIGASTRKLNDNTLIEEDKIYYTNALEWYFVKYLKNYIYVRYLFIVITIFAIAASLIYKTSLYDQEVKRYPFPVYFKDEINSFSNIKNISHENENIHVSIAKYMITKYLKKVEEFDFNSIRPEELKKRLNFIKNLSSLKVFQKYFQFVDIEENCNSPLLKYRYDNSKTIKIDKIIFKKDVNVPSSAVVHYTVYDKFYSKENLIKKNVEIKFLMSTIDKDFINSGKRLNFLITDFDTIE